MALPAGWELASDSRESSTARPERRVQFVFKPAGVDQPYLFVTVDHCAREVCERRLSRAKELESRRFLSDGSPGTDYFDSQLNVLWQRNDDSRTPNVSATFFGDKIVQFKFFHAAGQFGKLLPKVGTIVEHIRVWQPGEDAAAYNVSRNLFTPASETIFVRGLLWSIPLLLVVLVVVERTVSRRRFRREMAQIDADIASRNAEGKVPNQHRDEADEYVQQSLIARKRRKRRSP